MTGTRVRNGLKPAEPLLHVQVYQGPALQCEAEFSLKSRKIVRVGKSRRAELMIPFAPFPNDVHLFSITKWGARVRLDPRLEGFVSDSQRFGTTRDFIAPRGALKELATVLEPLELPIPEGSRGALELGGYTVVFRVAKVNQPANKIKITDAAPKAPFALPYGQNGVEKGGFFWGFIATVLVCVPGILWLNKTPLKGFHSIRDLSPLLAVQIIHPDHFQLLPWAFGKEFDSQEVPRQAVVWVDELRKKWQSEDKGQTYESVVPALRGLSVPENFYERQQAWQKSLSDQWQRVEQKRNTAAPGSFIRGQNAYSPLRVVVAGGSFGSLSERVKSNLERLQRTRASVISLIETEHAYMRDYFKDQGAEIPVIFDPPKEPGLFFRLAEKAFFDERAAFQAAEGFAALAREKQKERRPLESSNADAEEGSFVWSDDSMAFTHVFSTPSIPLLLGGENDLTRNVLLSVGKIPAPRAPKPVPKISMADVESTVRSRSPEVKSCYDSALNRNPRLNGSILWRWTISPAGRLLNAKVEKSTVRDSALVACLMKKIQGWTFPKPDNGAITISFPFRFVVRENLGTFERISQ